MNENKGSCFIKMYSASLKQNPEYLKGFTLIELLVVMALIGIFSFLIIASVDKAREKGRDSTIQSQFASLRAQAERYYSKYNKYEYDPPSNTLCYDEALGFGGENRILKDLKETSGATSIINLGNESPGAWNKVTCHARTLDSVNFDAWAVEAPMSGSTENAPLMYCLDSNGLLLQKTNVLIGATNSASLVGFSCTDNQ